MWPGAWTRAPVSCPTTLDRPITAQARARGPGRGTGTGALRLGVSAGDWQCPAGLFELEGSGPGSTDSEPEVAVAIMDSGCYYSRALKLAACHAMTLGQPWYNLVQPHSNTMMPLEFSSSVNY
jgi:hypothetical protein